MNPQEIWRGQCEAARRIEAEFGVQNALDYLVGEKFLNFLEAAETHPDFRAEVPAFAAEDRTIFERWQLAEYLETARQTGPFDPSLYDEDDDPEEVENERREDIRRSTRNLLLVEQAREWLWGDWIDDRLRVRVEGVVALPAPICRGVSADARRSDGPHRSSLGLLPAGLPLPHHGDLRCNVIPQRLPLGGRHLPVLEGDGYGVVE